MVTVTVVLRWEAAHRLQKVDSKCNSLHGHSYRADITVGCHCLSEAGMVMDFGELKELLWAHVVKPWDHAILLWEEDVELHSMAIHMGNKLAIFPDDVTAECLAETLLSKCKGRLLAYMDKTATGGSGLFVSRVKVFETDSCWAEAVNDGISQGRPVTP